MICLTKNNGSATVVLLIFLPAMLLLALFVTYVSQQYLSHIRNIEASEIAALALIARVDQDESEFNDRTYAESVIQLYLKDSRRIEIEYAKEKCEYGEPCMVGQMSSYVRNHIRVTTKHDSWLNFLPLSQGEKPFFKPEFEVSGGKITAKRTKARPMDIYLIVDISGSMYSNGRIEMMKNTMINTIKYIEGNQNPEFKTRISLIPFETDVIYDFDDPHYLYSYTITEPQLHYIEDWWKDKEFWKDQDLTHKSGSALARTVEISTTNYSEIIQKIKKLSPSGGTDHSNAIINGARVVNIATNNPNITNPEQLFIFITDGLDLYPHTSSFFLDRYSFCNQVKSRVEGKPNRFSMIGGTPTQMSMALITINVRLSGMDKVNMEACFGDNIYHAEDGTSDVYKYIINLINDTSGHFEV
ncbi:pilus assembly protein TadG [Shewanella sairae]|uniref:Pilus assembly protein TadG n=1 Tax=Shewanella sairae TaxID=190310 RepID=A0ABQ4PQH4_9GAMM|nr:vWA domain-containing protein [Shewanella sairae]MCL1132528.1 VWA domain-containing protein [Shewanella sairae]GIU51376.1 pilus assembly protein TadG [Shewanella sairae]